MQEADGSWTAWDTVTEAIATLGGQVLDHRPRYRIEAACAVLNRIEAQNSAGTG
ncbi:hypothetical protein [Aquamicrobium terrae]|uniref:Uncharacterized protein n=1 Tax=Aquamicrobium terrae TaxID=1324945 RepID=A0ABV2N1H6_9HYPH